MRPEIKAQDAARGRKWMQENRERHNARTKQWRQANPSAHAAHVRTSHERNPDGAKMAYKKYYAKNREKILAKDRDARIANLESFLQKERENYQRNRTSVLAKNKRWRESNPDKVAYQANKRRNAIAKRTPPWLCEAHIESMQTMFWLASMMAEATGECHHVDHIVPLRGRLVSGLNVPWNLQILTATENLKKSNSHGI